MEYRKQQHICLALFLSLMFITHSLSSTFSTVRVQWFVCQSMVYSTIVPLGTSRFFLYPVGRGAAASLFCFSFFSWSWAFYTRTVTTYTLAYYDCILHARKIPPRPYKPFSFFSSPLAGLGFQSRAGCQPLRMRVISSVSSPFCLFSLSINSCDEKCMCVISSPSRRVVVIEPANTQKKKGIFLPNVNIKVYRPSLY